jgi:hypothetical protein
MHDADAMAVEKRGEGMRKFDTDARKLKQFAGEDNPGDGQLNGDRVLRP